MKKGILNKVLFFLLLIAISATSNAQYPFSKKVKRIVFLGNSITYSGGYITDIETYFVEHYPQHQLEFINVGLPSETVSGLSEPDHAGGKFPRPDLHERLQRVLDVIKPDLVFACYGMNDGIYLPLDSGRFSAYQNGINWLNKMLLKSGVKRIIYITPPVHDEKELRTHGYNKVLDAYSAWLIKNGKEKKWEVIDLHTPMTQYLENGIAKNPAFKLAKDGIHPAEEGHWLIAKSVLKGLKQKVNDSLILTLKNTPKDKQLMELISRRQTIMKDAWLTAAGHKRPGMKKGLPIAEAKKKYNEIQLQIDSIRVDKR